MFWGTNPEEFKAYLSFNGNSSADSAKLQHKKDWEKEIGYEKIKWRNIERPKGKGWLGGS